MWDTVAPTDPLTERTIMNVIPMRRATNGQTPDQQEAELVILSAALHDAALRGVPGVADVLKFSRRIHETAERLATLT
jgi:hypothetical protein